MYDPNTDGFYYREPPQKMVFDGKRMRKPIQRKTVDYNCPMVEYLEVPQLTRTRPRSKLKLPCISGFVRVESSLSSRSSRLPIDPTEQLLSHRCTSHVRDIVASITQRRISVSVSVLLCS